MQSEDDRDDERVKIFFRLERDEDGFPPADVETMWAKAIGTDRYVLDNIPFFVRGVASADIVVAKDRDGELWFESVVSEGGHGTVRIFVRDTSRTAEVRVVVAGFGCESEGSHVPGYVAVDVRPDSNKPGLLEYLRREELADRIGYDEGCKNW